MNPAVTRWLEALRSGKYQQGIRKLHTKDDSGTESYCCLGVACAISDSVKAETSKFDNQTISYRSGEYFYKQYLPNIVSDELGLASKNGMFVQNKDTEAVVKLRSSGTLTSLAALNDNGATFEQIAQIIELKPQGLFRQLNSDHKDCSSMKLYELRRVPPSWEHPKAHSYDGLEYVRLQYITFEEAAKDWKKELAKWKPEDHICMFTNEPLEFWQVNPPPKREGRRTYTDQEATWFQAYSYQRAVPISPPFETTDELINYLTTKGDFSDKLWTLDEAKKLCQS